MCSSVMVRRRRFRNILAWDQSVVFKKNEISAQLVKAYSNKLAHVSITLFSPSQGPTDQMIKVVLGTRIPKMQQKLTKVTWTTCVEVNQAKSFISDFS